MSAEVTSNEPVDYCREIRARMHEDWQLHAKPRSIKKPTTVMSSGVACRAKFAFCI